MMSQLRLYWVQISVATSIILHNTFVQWHRYYTHNWSKKKQKRSTKKKTECKEWMVKSLYYKTEPKRKLLWASIYYRNRVELMLRVRLFRKYNNIIFEMFAWGFTIKANYYIHRIILIYEFVRGWIAIILDVHDIHNKSYKILSLSSNIINGVI